jgi:hypothetical protein
MVLEASELKISVPSLPKPDNPFDVVIEQLEDGYAACINHHQRHAVWDCPHCGRVLCDECVRRLRRVGGRLLRLCPGCSTPCVLSAWSEKVKGRKKSLIGVIADKVKNTFKRTTQMFAKVAPASEPKEKRRSRKR